jgi:outer membrane protein TolC
MVFAFAEARAASVTDFLADALAHSPRLETARAEVDAARSRAVRAGAWESPMLELGVANVPVTGRFDQDPMTMKMIGVAQRLPVFGANGLARQAGEQAVAADTASREAMRREVLGETWRAYAEAVAAVDRTQAAISHLNSMRRVAEAARARYQAGRGRLGEPLQAEAEAATIGADVARFEAEEAAARAHLTTVTGFPSGRAYGPLDPLPVTVVPLDLDTWRPAVADHPRMQAENARQAQYDLSARAARRSVWPDLELRASYGFREPLESGGHGGAVEQDDMFSASVGFMLPLFSGGREQAEARQLDAMARAAGAQAAQTELELLEAVEATVARVRGNVRVVSLLADTILVLRDRALEAAWSTYSAGGGDLSGTLMAAHARYESELEVADARRELAHAHGELLALTGRADLLGISLPNPAEGSDR